MRIIGGVLAGRHFDSRGFTGRPTTDLAKQALFNILTNRYDFEGLNVLDLYSGTGAIGFEFLSRRGCVTFVEANKKAAQELTRNAKGFALEEATIYNLKVEQFIKKATRTYDIIFADPPYDLPTLQEIPRWVTDANLLKDGGLLIVEHRQRTAMEVQPNEERQYGDSVFSFYNAPLKL